MYGRDVQRDFEEMFIYLPHLDGGCVVCVDRQYPL